ncbi:MAG: hypothetical protein JNN11_04020 [Candidatus Doudnabacteria bacterium]|nr:hypothetical protein [Candidatus Doudnabacteria bacterium]
MLRNIDKNILIDKTKENLKEANRLVVSQTAGFISSAFVLVAALAWNDTIKELIAQYFSTGRGLASRFAYTLIVTLIAVIVTSRLTKISEKFKLESKKDSKA